MELDDLKELISFLKDTDITELQVEKDGTKVKIRRQIMLSSLEMHSKPSLTTIEKTSEAEEDIQRLITITCPIVGTFYRAPSPDAPPFVDAGAKVRKGQVICIIEAMKLMNEIESEVDGVIVRALVENGQPVEYGEPLFLVEPLA
ncbi:MAG TPA: acetyl-CoA carboxylase biotin carboxyl carrier protein [Thermodesulfovibrionales bacterium]|nr:acetyl-CoA carboxylase biotin carboxyl carrier protein [Thermodesulfovibrionales bacterium]